MNAGLANDAMPYIWNLMKVCLNMLIVACDNITLSYESDPTVDAVAPGHEARVHDMRNIGMTMTQSLCPTVRVFGAGARYVSTVTLVLK